MSHRSGSVALARGHALRASAALCALAAVALLAVDRADGASVTPTVLDRDAVCAQIKPQRKELPVAAPTGSATFDDGTLTGAYTVEADNTLDWTSDELSVDYVLVSGAEGTSYYQYPGGTKADSDLAAPGGGAIDAVRFCYDNQNRGTLRIVKQTDPDGSTQRFRFHPSAELADADFELADGESIELRPQPGTYTVDEADTPGWKVDDISCDDSDSTASGSTATIVVGSGETITCTFRNVEVKPVPDKPAPVEQPKPQEQPAPAPELAPQAQPAPVVAAAPAPRLAVRAARVARRGTARLGRPTRCVTRRFRITVSGSPLRRIVFTVNGRRVRTVTARRGQRAFAVTLPAGRGTVQRVAARVTFANGARARTLRTTVLRCAPKPVTQRFTG
jgi:hypothetical protein